MYFVFRSYLNLMLYINAQVKLIQYNFGFPNSFISHNLRKLRILSCSFAPIAAFQRSSSINQFFFFFLPQYCQSSLQSSVQIHTQPKLFSNQIQHFIQKLKANVVMNKKKSNVSLIMDFHTNLNFPLMNCF